MGAVHLRISQVCLWITFCGLAACSSEDGGGENDEGILDPLISDNGLSENGISPNGVSANGLSGNGLSGNGLSSNGLSLNGLSANGLSATAFAAWFNSGFSNATSRASADQLMKYIVRCACSASQTRTFTNPTTKTTHSWQGNLGLATGWCNGSAATAAQQEWVSGCLVAHVNALSTSGGSPLHMQLSIRLNQSTPAISFSGEELGALTEPEGIYFGNLFDQQAGGKKGVYVARMNEDPTQNYCFRKDFGRSMVFAGSSVAAVKLAGWQQFSSPPVTPDFWFGPNFGRAVSCTSDASCVSANNGDTPTCSTAPDGKKYCIPKPNVCPVDANGNPVSCLDPSGRTWSRLVLAYTARDLVFNSNVVAGGATRVFNVREASHGDLITGLKNNAYVEIQDVHNVGPTSNYYRISLVYRGAGALRVETRPDSSSTRTLCGSQTVSCSTLECWAHFYNCKLTNNTKNWVRITGTAATEVQLDAMIIGVER